MQSNFSGRVWLIAECGMSGPVLLVRDPATTTGLRLRTIQRSVLQRPLVRADSYSPVLEDRPSFDQSLWRPWYRLSNIHASKRKVDVCVWFISSSNRPSKAVSKTLSVWCMNVNHIYLFYVKMKNCHQFYFFLRKNFLILTIGSIIYYQKSYGKRQNLQSTWKYRSKNKRRRETKQWIFDNDQIKSFYVVTPYSSR